jgi:hypothetical protein
VDGVVDPVPGGDVDARFALAVRFAGGAAASLVGSTRIGGRLERLFLGRRAESRPVTLKDVDARPLPIKLRDGIARMFAPLL